MKLSAITIGPRSRRTLTGIDSLAASIEKVGLIHPPAVRSVLREPRHGFVTTGNNDDEPNERR